ncbi:MAG TPA: type IV toxin-antitoxin system AbiEi family antitoxin domain-containing protein [Solirubrobacterales bacterium]
MGDVLDRNTAIAEFAARRHSIVTTAELAALGLGRRGVAGRARAGTLFRLYRGVYCTVHPALLTTEGRLLAAVRACGPGAALWRRSAAAHLGIRPQSGGPTEIIVPSTAGRADRPGVSSHRSASLVPADVAEVERIPTTTPRRTFADLRRILPPDHFRAALRRAEILRLDTGPQPEYAPDRSRSDLERRLFAACRSEGMPLPERNVSIGPYAVDFLWREQRLVLETDGWETHGTRTAFEEDRARDAYLTTRGFRPVRLTDRQVGDRGTLGATLRALLSAPS